MGVGTHGALARYFGIIGDGISECHFGLLRSPVAGVRGSCPGRCLQRGGFIADSAADCARKLANWRADSNFHGRILFMVESRLHFGATTWLSPMWFLKAASPSAADRPRAGGSWCVADNIDGFSSNLGPPGDRV